MKMLSKTKKKSFPNTVVFLKIVCLMLKVRGISFYYTEIEKFEIIQKGTIFLMYQEYPTDCVSRGRFHAKRLFFEKKSNEKHN